MNELIEWVKTERKKRKLSLREISNNANNVISYTHINDIIKYKQPISAKFCLGMAIAFNMPILEAFMLGDMLPSDEKIVAEIFIKFKKLPKEGQNKALNILEWLTQEYKIKD